MWVEVPNNEIKNLSTAHLILCDQDRIDLLNALHSYGATLTSIGALGSAPHAKQASRILRLLERLEVQWDDVA